jgi:hypothetical protein
MPGFTGGMGAKTTKIEFIYFVCPNCDYECQPSSTRLEIMMKRCHFKKCKKTGRTKEPECLREQGQRINVYRNSMDAGTKGMARSYMVDRSQSGMPPLKGEQGNKINTQELIDGMLQYQFCEKK